MNTKLVLLGTAGGPLPSPVRSGIAHAVVVGERVHLIDCGSGVTRQLRRAKILRDLHQVYLTHLHSDHDCEYFNLFLLGWPILQWNPPVNVFGPGPAGGLAGLPPDLDGEAPFPVVCPDQPTPGLIESTRLQFAAHAYDINVRLRDSGRQDLRDLVVPHEIAVPTGAGATGPEQVAPPMSPVVISEDDDVRVTAVLVQHAPVFPAFAFRFDTDGGSIVISGDTAPCANLITLATGADILVHEVFDDSADVHWTPGDDHRRRERRQREHLVNSHTPVSAIAKVAALAGVSRLVLTHFVPGEDVLPDEHWLQRIGPDFDGEVVVGRDLAELTL
ncbi:MAG TPA: MBL fold metallo-hydrolase [Acidimicrobiales bacterium]|nr:MBL fold metallo-hydrolase [Acidimicrobiales bacterium]